MRNLIKILPIFLLLPFVGLAGNKDRAGEAGAAQLLINPWARSSSMGGANSSSVGGLESQFLNVAGLTKTLGTELIFIRTNWLVGTDISINSFGFSQKVGEKNFLSLGIMSFSMGEIEITTVDLPEGGIGTYKPQFLNLGLSYARKFTDNISGGITARIISEAIANINGRGIALDAGIQYKTGAKDQISFGMSLKNAGPKMVYRGDGLTVRATIQGQENSSSLEQRSQPFELPLLMNIGGGYRFDFGDSHKLQTSATFTANSFQNDQYRLGVEYKFKKYFMARLGFVYEDGIFDIKTRSSAFTGPTGGFSIEIPYSKKSTVFGFDYSYRDTNPFQGTHSFGARLTF